MSIVIQGFYGTSAGSGEGGVTDHGALTGRADDDHPQYYNQTRGDARYAALGHGHDELALAETAIQPAVTEYNIGNLGSAYQIDLANGTKQRGTLNASCTLTAATPSGATTIRLRIVNSGAGNTITLSGIRWVGGEAPTLTTVDTGENLIVLDYGSTGWIADGASL